jgi:hypothetical protein
MSSFTRAAWFGSVALAAALAFTAFLGDARAAFNVKEFSCTTTPFGVSVDVSGLGNTNVCIAGSADVGLNCACAGGGGNCPSDAKKQTISATFTSSQSVAPKNGRVITTFTLPFNPTDGLCTTESPALTCPSGQDAKLVSWAIPTGGADFALCTTTAPANQPCTCNGTTFDTLTCGPTSDVVFAGKKGSCLARFP